MGMSVSERVQIAPESVARHDAGFLLDVYERMLLIRQFEDRVKLLFLEGSMPGTIHQCQGQEGSAVGVCFSPSMSWTWPPIMPPTVPEAEASSATSRARTASEAWGSFPRTSKARVSSESPARMAMSSPKTT